MKPPDLLNRLPSVSELLEKPPIRAIADRWNRSTVAGSLRSFLDELRVDFERRTAELPSIRELAERAAAYVLSRQHRSLGIAINATGRIVGSPWRSLPLAEPALERAFAFGRDFGVEPEASIEIATSGLDLLLCRLTGAKAAAVVNSYSGAVWVALAALAADRDVIISRADVGDVESGDTLPKLALSAQTTLREVGATNRVTTSDYESAISPRAAAILTISADSYCVVGETAEVGLADLVAVARRRDLPIFDALGAAPLIDPPASITWPRRSAQSSIAAGANLTILRGDGLVGGPSCGILLGEKDLIGRITSHLLYTACRLDPFRAAALTATVACYDRESRGTDAIPVWQCLTTSIENLKNRAERMAAQLAHVPGVSSATPLETRSPISGAIAGGWPSYGVALAPADGNLSALVARLQTARVPIYGRPERPSLILDLRTVLPRQDKVIVDALLDQSPIDTAPANAAASEPA